MDDEAMNKCFGDFVQKYLCGETHWFLCAVRQYLRFSVHWRCSKRMDNFVTDLSDADLRLRRCNESGCLSLGGKELERVVSSSKRDLRV